MHARTTRIPQVYTLLLLAATKPAGQEVVSSGGNKTKAANENKYRCFHANRTNNKNKRENTENYAVKKWNYLPEFFL